MSYILMDSPIGKLTVMEREGQITEIFFGERRREAEEEMTVVLQEAKRQLLLYFEGERTVFDLPLNPKGTPFQEEVWKHLLKIPYGETRSYGQIAKDIGKPKAVRAVGGANHRNPISIIIPCHRVIGSDGSLTGYGGGLDIKRYLLNLEQRVLKKNDA